jgi:hypothetical protein
MELELFPPTLPENIVQEKSSEVENSWVLSSRCLRATRERRKLHKKESATP